MNVFERLARIEILSDLIHERWKALGEDRCDICTKIITKRQKYKRIRFSDVTIQWHEICLKKMQAESLPIMRTPIMFKKGDIIN